MSANLNTYGDCDSEGKGSGRIGCDKSNWGDLKGFVLVRKGTSFAVTDGLAAITKAIWDAAIDGLKLFPYVGAYDYDSTPGANEFNTSTIQVKRLVRNGLPEIAFMYIDGNCRHASLWDKQGFKQWDVILLYANGMRMAHNFDISKVRGFDAGHFSVDTETIQKGTDLQVSKCMFQLLDADEFAVRNAFFTWNELGFDAREENGFNNVTVNLFGGSADTTPTAPATGTHIFATVNPDCNKSIGVSSLDDKDLWVVGGTQTTPKTIASMVWNATAKKYDFTLSSALIAGDTISLTLKSKTGGYTVATDIAGERFKGKSKLGTVA